MTITASTVEHTVLECFGELGYATTHGPNLNSNYDPGELSREATVSKMEMVRTVGARHTRYEGIEVRVAEETVWLTQKLIRVLIDKGRSTITEHLKNILESGELDEKAVCRDFRQTAEDGKDYTTRFLNDGAIIAVGFCERSGQDLIGKKIQ